MHTGQQTLLHSLCLETTGVPIYVQVRDQIRRALDLGMLPGGAQMPTMRQVAVALKIDLNTVRHAYDELERAGAITLERGRGSFVAPAAAGAASSPDQPIDVLARQTLAAATALGLDPLALAQRIERLAQHKEDPS